MEHHLSAARENRQSVRTSRRLPAVEPVAQGIDDDSAYYQSAIRIVRFRSIANLTKATRSWTFSLRIRLAR